MAAKLEAVALEGESPERADPVRLLIDSCTAVGRAWSGSWLGYHSRIYYRDLQPPPPGARFSSEWGFNQAFSNDTRGDWVEYSYDFVVASIEQLAGDPDLGPAEESAKRARKTLEESRGTVVSILTAALSVRDDPLVRENLEEAKEIKSLSQNDVVRMQMPSGSIMSRDMQAVSEGITGPPHLGYLGGLVEIRDPGLRCGDLAKLANRVAAHLDRISQHTKKGAATGSRVFIGHGGSPLWRELKDFLSDRLNLEWEEFNRVSPAGIATVNRLSSMLDNTSMAFLVMTAEDEHADGSEHARENVIHEAGLFQGRVGFPRAPGFHWRGRSSGDAHVVSHGSRGRIRAHSHSRTAA